MSADSVGEDLASLQQKAAVIYRARRERDRQLGDYATLMGEPAWDTMLQLFIVHGEPLDDRISGDEANNSSRRDASVFWIAVLHKLGLVERHDRRPGGGCPIRLSDIGIELIARAIAHA